MSVFRTRVMRGSFASLTLGGLVAGFSGGCGGPPTTGTQAVESPAVQEKREGAIKDMMKKGAYGDQYKDKGGPSK